MLICYLPFVTCLFRNARESGKAETAFRELPYPLQWCAIKAFNLFRAYQQKRGHR